MVIYTIQTIKQLRFNLSGKKEIKKARHWNFKCLSVVHNVYK